MDRSSIDMAAIICLILIVVFQTAKGLSYQKHYKRIENYKASQERYYQQKMNVTESVIKTLERQSIPELSDEIARQHDYYKIWVSKFEAAQQIPT